MTVNLKIKDCLNIYLEHSFDLRILHEFWRVGIYDTKIVLMIVNDDMQLKSHIQTKKLCKL